jgi:hypothetical protein
MYFKQMYMHIFAKEKRKNHVTTSPNQRWDM